MFDLVLPLVNNMTVWAPGIFLLGIFVGSLTGLFGVGGGFLLTPSLNILFGIPYPVAVGSDLLQIFCTGSVSAFKHWRLKNFDLRLGWVMGISAVIGAEVGKRIMDLLEKGGGTTPLTIIINGHEHLVLTLTLNILFLILLSSVMITMLRETSGRQKESEGKTSTGISRRLHGLKILPLMSFPDSGISSMSFWVPFVVSFLVAILSGLMGIGGGFIMFPILLYVIGVPTKIAVGTSAFRILFSSGYGAFTHYGAGHVEFRLVAILLAGSMIGVQLGVLISKRLGALKIRKYFSYVIGLGIVMILYNLVYSFLFGTAAS